MKNYYNILGIPSDASLEQVNEAYKKLALKFHPDRNNNDEFFSHWFKEINEAKQVLGNIDDRLQYDDKLEALENVFESQQFAVNNPRSVFTPPTLKQLQMQSPKSKWWMAAVALLFLVCYFIAIEDNDSKPVTNNLEAIAFSAKAFTGDSSKTSAVGPALAVAEILKPVKTAPKSKLVMQTDVVHADEIRPNDAQLEAGRTLTSKELDAIVNDVMTINKSNCVQVIQTQNSNIKKDFALARRLSQLGFTIAGRSIINSDLHGFEVIEKEDCIHLIVGVLPTD